MMRDPVFWLMAACAFSGALIGSGITAYALEVLR